MDKTILDIINFWILNQSNKDNSLEDLPSNFHSQFIENLSLNNVVELKRFLENCSINIDLEKYPVDLLFNDFADLVLNNDDANLSNLITTHPLFKEALDFNKQTCRSLQNIERNEIKKRFSKPNKEEGEINDFELETAIKSIERKEIKERFNSINISKKDAKKFYLLKIAASLLILLIPSYFFFQNKKGPENLIVDNTILIEENKNVPPVFKSLKDRESSLKKYKPSSISLDILKEEQFGYAKSESNKNLKIKIYNINDLLREIGNCLDTTYNAKHYQDSNCIAIKNSIKLLSQTFVLDGKVLSLYLKNRFRTNSLKVFKLEEYANYIIKVGDNYFEVFSTLKQKPLIPIKNMDIIELCEEM